MDNKEWYQLGVAVGSFSVGEIDQGVHAVLPVTIVDTGEHRNDVFASLVAEFEQIGPQEQSNGMPFLEACWAFARANGVEPF